MAEPFIGEIRVFAFGTVPSGWAQCNGQLLQIESNQALYSILGDTYGGDGETTFALPNLCGRVPCCVAATMKIGQSGGEEAHTLTVSEIPEHVHYATASSADTAAMNALNNQWGSGDNIYDQNANTTMSENALATSGGSQAHPNMQPYLVANFCVALEGIFPPRN